MKFFTFRTAAFDLLVLVGVLNFSGCGPTSPPNLLFPSPAARDIQFVCDSIHSRHDLPGRPLIVSSPPELLVINNSTVTIYFANNHTQTIPRDASMSIPAGTYRCNR